MPVAGFQTVVSDSEALKLVMEMMAIPGRSGEEAATMISNSAARSLGAVSAVVDESPPRFSRRT